MPSNYTHRLIAEVVSQLSLEGHSIGVDQYLEIQELLNRLPEDLPESSIKEMLVPILATSPQEQQHLYNLFDQVQARYQQIDANKAEVKQKESRVYFWRNLVIIAFVLLFFAAGLLADSLVFDFYQNPTFVFGFLVLVLGSVFLLRQVKSWPWRIGLASVYLIAAVFGNSLKNLVIDQATEALVRPSFDFKLEVGQEVREDIYNVSREPLQEVYFERESSFTVHGTFELLDSFRFAYRAEKPTVDQKDTVILTLETISENRIQQTYTFSVFEPAEVADISSPERVTEMRVSLQPLDKPFPHDYESLEVDPELLARAQFYEQFEVWIKVLLISFITFFLLTIIKWRQKEEEKVIAELESHDQPPYVWNLEIGEEWDLNLEEDLKLILNQLRKRTIDDRVKLDVPGTVLKTARKAGRITFAYRPVTQPGSYLLLIDRHHLQDHRSRLFDYLYQYFLQEEVDIERFFYDGDPRLCFNEAYPKGISLNALQQRYSDMRLLMVGSGHQLLHPILGGLSRWTDLFKEWSHRAILTPRPIGEWNKKERLLTQIFHVMPASMKGLELTLEQFDSKDPIPWEDAIGRATDAPLEPVLFENNVKDTLECHFSPKMIEWIAACAIYPGLNWELTIFWGLQLSTAKEKLLTVEHLLELCRLPWFIEGKIPDYARLELLRLIPDEKEKEYRQQLNELFLKAQPPVEGSVAMDEYRMQVLLNDLLTTDDPEKKEEYENQYAQYLAADYQADFAILKYLEKEESRLDFYVPEEWKAMASAKRKKKAPPLVPSMWQSLKYTGALLSIVVGVGVVVSVVGFYIDQYFNGDLADEISANPWYIVVLFFILVPFALWIAWFWMVYQPTKYLIKNQFFRQIRRLVPNPFQRKLERNHVPQLSWIVPLWLILVVFSIFFDPMFQPCRGTMRTYEPYPEEIEQGQRKDINTRYCLSTPRDVLIYNEMLALKAQEFSDYQLIDSLNRNLPIYYALNADSTTYEVQFANQRSALIAQQHQRMRDENALRLFIQDTLLQLQEEDDDVEVIPLLAVSDNQLLLQQDIAGIVDSIFPFREYAENLAVENYNRGIKYFNEYQRLISGNRLPPNMAQQNISQNSSQEPLFNLSEEDLLFAEYNLNLATAYFFLGYLYNTNQNSIREVLTNIIKQQKGFRPSDSDIELIPELQLVDNSGVPIEGASVNSTFGETLTDENGYFEIRIPALRQDTTFELEITAGGFESASLDLVANESLQGKVIRLRQLRKKAEQVNIFMDENTQLKGLRTASGRIILPAQYAAIEQDPRSGLYRVQQSQKTGIRMGMVNEEGTMVIPITYRSLSFSSGGLIRAEKDLYGYLDTKGKVVIDFQYTYASDFGKGIAEVHQTLRGIDYPFLIDQNGLCLSNCPPIYGKMRDDLTGREYETVQIGDQVWLVANLRSNTFSSYCYDDEASLCEEEGRLYEWNAAMNACPRGWRLPTQADWRTLIDRSDRGLPFKVALAGIRNTQGEYRYRGAEAHFWTATNPNNSDAPVFLIFSRAELSGKTKVEFQLTRDSEKQLNYRFSNSGFQTDALSCRCIKDFSK